MKTIFIKSSTRPTDIASARWIIWRSYFEYFIKTAVKWMVEKRLEQKTNHWVIRFTFLPYLWQLCAQSRTHTIEEQLCFANPLSHSFFYSCKSSALCAFLLGTCYCFKQEKQAPKQKEARALGILKFRAVGTCNILRDCHLHYPGHFY